MKTCPVCRRSWADEFRMCPIDGVPLLDAVAGVESDAWVGKSIGQCRIVEKIADGSLGPIYKAEDPVRGAVAMQLVAKDRVASPVLLEAFTDAVKTAAQINHPNVIRTYGLETAPDGAPAIVMEFVQGMTLQKYRQGHPGMLPAEACGIVRQAAEGLIAAHRISLVHGALHPLRLFVTPDMKIKVAGFFRSGVREGVDAYTATPESLPYLAPEQIGVERDVPGPDYRTDVYALGVILYELLAGRLPYDAKNPHDMAIIMEGAPPLPPNFANPQVTPLLSRVVLRAIARHPSERPASVEEFMRELDAAGQPAREPQRPAPAPRIEPQYPPPSADSGLFAPSAPSQESGLFGPPSSSASRDPWASPAPPDKSGDGEGSAFNWFKTRVGSKSSASAPRQRKAGFDDSTFAGREPARRSSDDFEERTVVVSGDRKRRGGSDTFVGGSQRDMDMTGTGTLPRRRFSSKSYLILGAAAFLLLAAIGLYIFFSMSGSTGKLMVDSTPPGAQVYINDEYRGATPLPYTELKAGAYRVRVQLDGYEAKVESVDIAAHADVQRAYALVRQAPLIPAAVAAPEPAIPEPLPATPRTTPAKLPPYAGMIQSALRARNYFPPSPDSAADLLQRWAQTPGEEGSSALEQSRQSFCREVEALGKEKLEQKDFGGTRSLLDQLRSRGPSANCATGLQTAYEKAVGNSLSDLRISARAAMDRQNYVAPDNDNALRYVRLILAIDPQDSEAKAMDVDIAGRAADQARAKSNAHQHAEALDIYLGIKRYYSNPPMGAAALDQNIEKERAKVALIKQMNVPFSVPVKHNHGHSFLVFGGSECTGILRIDGYGMKYTTTGEHQFQLTYDGLKSFTLDKSKVVIQGVGVPQGKIEMEAADPSAGQQFQQLKAKIDEYRRLNAEYMK